MIRAVKSRTESNESRSMLCGPELNQMNRALPWLQNMKQETQIQYLLGENKIVSY